MPRSVKRRLELLESRTTRVPKQPGPGYILDTIQRAVATGHWLTRSPGFEQAWQNYLAVLKQSVTAAGPPPPEYLSDQLESERQRLWAHFDCPLLKSAVSSLLVEVGKWPELIDSQQTDSEGVE
jgi:hypothetical protein